MSFTYRTESFEGPLELLLSLIESEKMPITELSLAHVAAEFLQYVQNIEHFDTDTVSRFLSVASTLLLLKARALLPVPDLSPEEEVDIQQLEHRLKVYNAIIEGATVLRTVLDTGEPLYVRQSSWQSHPTYIPDSNLTADTLHSVCVSMLSKQNVDADAPVSDLVELRVRSLMKLEDVMERLHSMITTGERFSLRSTLRPGSDPIQVKVDTIVSFLAILELARNGLVLLNQSDHGSDIWLETPGRAVEYTEN